MRFFHATILLCACAGACGGSAFTPATDGGGAGGAPGSGGTAAGFGGSAATGGAGTGGIIADGASGSAGTAAMGGTVDAATDTSDGGGSGGALRNSGDCDSKDDCGGDPCVELIAGGYRVCVTPVPEVTTCSIPSGQCCKSSDCGGPAGSKCVAGPAQSSCGPAIIPTNACVTDECRTALDCSGKNSICAPAGFLGSKAAKCSDGGCRFDRDCAGAGAICAPVAASCCSTFVGLYCVDPGGCQTDADCGAGQHCTVQGNRTACVSGAVACPASL
jgi:hypothetical protein